MIDTAPPADSAAAQFPVATAAAAPRRSARRATLAGLLHWLLALVDQALVSGTRFLATIIVGRFCGPGELGTYSLAFSVLVLAGCFQEAVITTPYAVLSQRMRRRSRATYAGAIARMHIIGAIGSAVILLALAAIGILLHAQTLATIALVLAITLPCSLVVEFARRFTLAQLDVRWATGLDAAISAIQLTTMFLLAETAWLSADVALLAVGVAYLLPAVFWWSLYGKSRMRATASAAPYWRRNWALGRWLAASQLMAAVHGLMPAWLLALLVDTHATGHFVAYMNLALLANPLIFAVGNLLTPRAAQALARDGVQAAQHLVLRVLLYLVTLMAVFALGLHIAGHKIVQCVYGESFAGLERVAGLLGLTATMWAISAMCASGLAALGRPRWSFVASCTGSIVTVVLIILLAPTWSVYGATLGMFLGAATAAGVHGWAFMRVSGGLGAKRSSSAHSAYDHRLAIQDCTNG